MLTVFLSLMHVIAKFNCTIPGTVLNFTDKSYQTKTNLTSTGTAVLVTTTINTSNSNMTTNGYSMILYYVPIMLGGCLSFMVIAIVCTCIRVIGFWGEKKRHSYAATTIVSKPVTSNKCHNLEEVVEWQQQNQRMQTIT